MPWFSNPQRDSRHDIRAAQQALVYAGYPHSHAVAEYETYRYRVRAALAAPRDIVWAGFVVGALMAVVGLAALLLFAGIGGIVAILVEAPLVPAEPGTPAPAKSHRVSLLDFLPAILVTTWVLGIAGAGIALVTRNRWSRARVLETFIDVAPRRIYLLETAAVWLVVAALIAVIAWTQAGPRMAGTTLGLLAFIGIPLLAVVFGAGFPGLYKWVLPRISPLDAAAYARPIVEREAALQVVADREFYGRNAYHAAYDRRVWADDVLAREGLSEAARRQTAADRIAQKAGAHLDASPWWRLRLYGLLLSSGTLVGWVLTRMVIWAGNTPFLPRLPRPGGGIPEEWNEPMLAPLSAGLGADLAGLAVGLILGVGLVWLYTHHLE